MKIVKSRASNALSGAQLFGATLLSASATVLPQLALAQTETPRNEGALEEIVVTGTLIRGVAPVGTNVSTLSQEQIVATGAMSTQQLMASVPQITSAFNTTPSVNTGLNGLTIVRPNIRNLAANGGNTTAVLLNGHSMVGAGVLQTTPDVGMIPPGALERVDVMADGGSSLYGSDAIGGIVNLITRRKMDGIEFAAHYGVGDSYDSGEASLTGGTSWSAGSALFSYNYRKNTNVLGADRDYYRQDLTRFGGNDNRVTSCEPGNVSAGGVNYALPGRVANTVNRCDQDLVRDLFPEESQHSVFVSLDQDLTDTVKFDVTGYYADRETTRLIEQNASSNVVITNTSPFFQPIGTETRQTLAYNYSSVFGPNHPATTNIKEVGITPEVTFSFANDWQLAALANYGRSKTEAFTPQINPAAEAAALAGTTIATALNPYNIAATNPAVLQGIRNFAQQAENEQTLTEAKVVADGPAVQMAGGALRLAFGAQWQKQESDARQTDAPAGDFSNAAHAAEDRTIKAVFGQVVLPLVGTSNAKTGIYELTLDASVRYDDYSDFGDTTNPKFGVSYSPIVDLTFRGNYGTSFNAPSLADTAGAVDVRAQVVPVSPWQPAFSPANFIRPTILLAGGNTAGLKPQEADTYSFGVDYSPSGLSGLQLSLTYWNVSIDDVIQVTPFFSPTIFTNPNLARFFVLNPTRAQAEALIGSQRIQGPSLDTLYATGVGPFAIFDAHRNNLGTLDTDGIDFSAFYIADTGIGQLSASLAGSYTLGRESSVAGGVTFDELKNGISEMQLSATLGIRYQSFFARVGVNYNRGYSVVGIPNQTSVDAFHPVNLFFSYDFEQEGILHDTQVTLNVNNVADDDPPFQNAVNGATADGTANGATFGRFVSFGLRKKF